MSMEHISNVIDRVMKYFFNFACRTYKILNRYENDNEKTNIADTIEYEKFDDENISGTTYAGIKRIMECIATGDAKTLAALTIYPIHRKYPLKDITRRRQMIDQFNMVFDEAFREKLQHARVEEWNKVKR